MKEILTKLAVIQMTLKAPKGQYNSFGKYHYRSCEDILEALKPLLSAQQCTLTVRDEIAVIGDRYYVKATATLYDMNSNDYIEGVAYARESEKKTGMDESQITGTASSYARKYALNGLFCIDDTQDADTDGYQNQQNNNSNKPKNEYKCCDCGKKFDGFTGKDGKQYTAAQAYHISEKMNTDGKARCGECMKKAGTRKEAQK